MTNIKDKERILKLAREKQQRTYKGTPIRLSVDFSAETLQGRREWHNIFKVMKQKMLQQKLLYRSEEHTSELQSHHDLVCRLLLEKKMRIV